MIFAKDRLFKHDFYSWHAREAVYHGLRVYNTFNKTTNIYVGVRNMKSGSYDGDCYAAQNGNTFWQ